MDGPWKTALLLPFPPLCPHHRDIHRLCRCSKAAQASWIQIRKVWGALQCSILLGHREMLCLVVWKCSGLHSALWDLWRPLIGCCNRHPWGDRAGNSPVNLNTSMKRKDSSPCGARHTLRWKMPQHRAAFVLDVGALHTDWIYLLSQEKCTSYCSTVPPTFSSFWNELRNVSELCTSSHCWTLK